LTDGAPTVHVNRLEDALELTRQDVVDAVLAVLGAEEVEGGEFSVTFLAADAMAALNQKHLERVGPTDVIAFEFGEPEALLGDIYICPEVARESAAEYAVQPREELLRLVIHGMLHVLGYDHPEGPDRTDSPMFRRQESILASLSFDSA
jgi:probable rRNA maturation factor